MYVSGAVSEIAFVPDLGEYDAALEDVRNIHDPDLRAAWNFGDYFEFCAEHGDRTMGRMSWPEALEAGRHIVDDLRQRRPLSDERAAQYAENRRATSGPSIFVVDIGPLPDKPSIPAFLRGLVLPHYHRRGPGGMERHRPWDSGPRGSTTGILMPADPGVTPAGPGSDHHHIFADCLERALNMYVSGAVCEIAFVASLAEHDASLYDIRNVDDPALRAAWMFGDYFAYCAEHGVATMCHMPWHEALEVGKHIVDELRQRRPLTDARAALFASI